MEAVGDSVLSSTLQVLFDRIAPNQKFLVGCFPGNKKLQLKRLERALRIVSQVLQDAENKQGKSPDVKTWFNGIKHAVYKVDDVLDEINTKRSRIQLRHSTGDVSDNDFNDQFIGELSPRLEEILDELKTFGSQIDMLDLEILYGKEKREDKLLSTSVVIPSQIFGRDDEKEKIIQMVLSGEGATDVAVIPITGMGGIGKTTLAQLVYNDARVKYHFEIRAWVCVSEEFDVYRATRELLMEVNSSVLDEKDDLISLQVKLKDNLEGKCFIIILDDIWNDNYSDCQHLMSPLNSGRRGSKIIVTTRNENIALMLQSDPFHHLKPISNDQCWALFKLHAFDHRARPLSHEIVLIGKRIVEKCRGLPLAIKTVAGALRSTSDIREWRDILSSDNWLDVGDILPALSLSYKLLPSHLKCCFAFCAIFPKDIPFDKKEVALLWMANDLVQPSCHKVAENYFEELSSRSFFEVVNNKYLMHDLVNDLAQYICGNFSARREDYQLRGIQGEDDLPSEVLHFSYLSSRNDTLERFRSLVQVHGLRTFLPIPHPEDYARITTSFFTYMLPKLRHIRALSFNQYDIYEIGNSIGDLTQLRLLNLASSSIKKLPDGITKCLNLQTLILAGCKKLKELPEDMGLLINLQHINISGCRKLKELPEDMRLLINLQHLDFRGVGFNLIGKMDSWLSKLKDIQNLSIVVDEIHGSALEQLDKLQLGQLLEISGLDNKVTIEMAKNAELKNKSYIENLTLKWSGVPQSSEDGLPECSDDELPESSENELNIFAELIPHTNIRQVSIKGYRGTTFSNWLGDSSFCNIEFLTLEDCRNCFRLPPLGQLSALKRLEISGMDGITEVGEEFYGNSSFTFPRLQFLRISNCNNILSFPKRGLPVPSLKKFIIICCSKLKSLPEQIHTQLSSLSKLTISNCPEMECFPDGGLPPSLENLDIESCKKLKSLPQQMHTELSSLRHLSISYCPNMECFPDNGLPPRLECLYIKSCKKLFQRNWGWGLERLRSFIKLSIYEFEDDSFPEEGLLSGTLQHLYIENCPYLEILNPNDFQNISTLKVLSINGCPELRYLPEDGLPSSLSTFIICDCPKLNARIEKYRGEEWSKVSHIPTIFIDNKLIQNF